jgi:phosphomannomutase
LFPSFCIIEAAVLASIVSSRMLKTVAKAEGIQYYDTLTGFKWLGNCSMDLRASGVDVLFSYEEALGFCVGDVLCDKDGISAASMFIEMASALEAGWTEENEQV